MSALFWLLNSLSVCTFTLLDGQLSLCIYSYSFGCSIIPLSLQLLFWLLNYPSAHLPFWLLNYPSVSTVMLWAAQLSLCLHIYPFGCSIIPLSAHLPFGLLNYPSVCSYPSACTVTLLVVGLYLWLQLHFWLLKYTSHCTVISLAVQLCLWLHSLSLWLLSHPSDCSYSFCCPIFPVADLQ